MGLLDRTRFTTARELIELMVADKFDKLPAPERGEVREFTAIALTDAIPLSKTKFYQYVATGNPKPSGTGTARFILKAMITGDTDGNPLPPTHNPHRYLLNPCSLDKTRRKDVNFALRTILTYTTYISSKDFVITDTKELTIRKNDQIKVSMTVDDNDDIIMENGEIIELVSRAANNPLLTSPCENLNGLFKKKVSQSLMGGGHDYTPALNAKASSRAVDFYNLLKKYFPESEYCDSFLMGLTANAQAESNFKESANGDPRDPGKVPQAIEVDGSHYCSFGYWQLNVCSGGGVRFAKAHGITDVISNKEELYKIITDGDTQMKYMVHYMKKKFGADVKDCSKSAEYWGRRIAVEFEICAHCKAYGSGGNATQTVERGAIATDLDTKV